MNNNDEFSGWLVGCMVGAYYEKSEELLWTQMLVQLNFNSEVMLDHCKYYEYFV